MYSRQNTYNYRRVFVDEAKFKHIYGNAYSPVWINGRFFGMEAIAIVVASFLSYSFHGFQNDNLSLGCGFVLASAVVVYLLDRHVKIDNLPFERQVMALVPYYYRYHFKHSQLYQDEKVESANKQYRIL
ncbi:MFS transporter permease [Fructobacillus sp. M158]|uniref:MFS transporter permease n=1 Tax=Fructobacillus parabroussonetiae TaxID=2713174 RepID=UPI00200A1186|nr:MFS transporter permease [Fructobacillus parabroussonetiae]MCK8617043.1 MFS transporter permease [Fructobacillus parabroussonetiae]